MPPAYELLLLNTSIPQIQAAQSGDTYLCPRELAVVVNSSTDALRITQTGAGNAILVEDSANPDSTPFVVTAAGNVGIGETNPTRKLQVTSGTAADTGYFASTATPAYTATAYNGGNARISMIGGNASGATTGINFSQGGSFEAYFGGVQESGGAAAFVWQGYSGAAYAERMRLDSSGNLGLGVTISNWQTGGKFQVGAGQTIGSVGNGLVLASNWYYNTTDKFAGTGYASYYNQVNGVHSWHTSTTSGSIGNNAVLSQAMTLDASGNLLVGTTSTSGLITGQLQLGTTSSATAGIQILNSTTGVGGIYFGDSTTGNARFRGMVEYNHTADALILSTAETERARITSGGDLLVGTTSGSDKIVVEQSTAASASLFINSSGTASAQCVNAWHKNTTGDNVFLQFFTEASATSRGSISYNRTAGLVAYNTTSDYRAKDILGPVANSGATIDALKVYEGKMKGAAQSRPMLVAHEAQEHAPYAVTGEKDAVNEDGTPKYQQMDVSSLVPLLLAEVQSLRARVAQLEAK